MCLPIRSILPLSPVSFGKENDLRSPEVQLTTGSRRVFRQFLWLGARSVKMALSRPTHQPRLGTAVREDGVRDG